jgi:hypothetical protein
VNFSLARSFGLSFNALLEWVLIELALNAYGKVGVSLYDTLGNESVGTFLLRKTAESTLGINHDVSQGICEIFNNWRGTHNLMAIQYRPCPPYSYLHYFLSLGKPTQGRPASPSFKVYRGH